MKYIFLTLPFMLLLTSCTPEAYCDKWCTNQKEKPQGKWTANEVTDYAKNCIFK